MGWWIFAVIGYFCGSIPFGLLLTQAAGLGDVRAIGSGNIGATNVLRTGNKKIAALTLLCDLAKGLLPVLVAKHFGGEVAGVAAGYGAMAGHIFPVWLEFKGGKGVATGLGVMFGWSWWVAVPAVLVWMAVFYFTRLSSASALAAALVAIPLSMYFGLAVWPVVILTAIVFITHRANIGRLLRGEEPKSSFSKKP